MGYVAFKDMLRERHQTRILPKSKSLMPLAQHIF